MKRVELTILITPELLDRIERHATGQGRTRSAIVRAWLERGLALDTVEPTERDLRERRRAQRHRVEVMRRELDALDIIKQLLALDEAEARRRHANGSGR
jgi:hypothetical protein